MRNVFTDLIQEQPPALRKPALAGLNEGRDGILRLDTDPSTTEDQTIKTFTKLHTDKDYDHDRALADMVQTYWPDRDLLIGPCLSGRGLVLDVGCGPAAVGRRFFASYADRIHYCGLDAGDHIRKAKEAMAQTGTPASFIQCRIEQFPVETPVFDFVLAHGVLHHTDSVPLALAKIAKSVRHGGGLALSVNKRLPRLSQLMTEGMRHWLHGLDDAAFAQAMDEITQLGAAIDTAQAKVSLQTDLEALEIPAGNHDLHRLLHYYVIRMFSNRDWGYDRSRLQNIDWYRPANSHATDVDELSDLVARVGLEVVDVYEPTPSAICLYARRHEDGR